MLQKKINHTRIKTTMQLFSMMIPGLAYLLINNYIPMAGIIVAFKKFNYAKGIWESPWCGFKNFRFLFTTRDAFVITRNTLCYNIAFIILGTVLAVAVAIILNELTSRLMKKAYQTFILIPYLISMVVVSYIVYGFLSQDNGFLNNLLVHVFNMKKVSWYTEPKRWPYILTAVNLWKNFGYSSIIYYATVIGIDTALYEAASIDGASKWKQIGYITLPELRPTIIILVLLQLGRVFYSDFGLFYQVPLNSGMLMDATNTIDTYVYRGLTQLNDIGRASAAGFYQAVLGFVLILTVNKLVRTIDKDSALF